MVVTVLRRCRAVLTVTDARRTAGAIAYGEDAVGEAVAYEVRDSTVVVERREHAADRGEDVVDAADVEERSC